MIAVISDVHGNLPALQAVFAEIDRLGAQRVWCLGDTLGYGPYVNECMGMVSQRCEIVLAGNHDLVVRGDLDIGLFGGSAGAGVRHAIATMDEQTRAVLANLRPSRIVGDQLELYHASSRDPVWEYVKDPHAAAAHLAVQRLPISFVGHSHLQVAFQLMPDGSVQGGKVEPGGVVPIDPAGKRVVNPGSVGQPRDRDPRAAFATIDNGGVTMRRVAYDIAAMRRAVEAAGLPSEIGERLELGW